MEKIKTLYIITRLIVGGAQETAIQSCELLNHDRYDVHLLSGPETGAEGEMISLARQLGIPLTVLPSLVREISPVKDLQTLLQLRAFIKKGKYQIVHTHCSKAGILGRIAARMARVPVIVHTAHGWGHTAFKSRLKKAIFVCLERFSGRFTDKFIAVSRLDIDEGLRQGIGARDKYVTIRSAIALDEFAGAQPDAAAMKKELGLAPDTLIVGSVGRLSPQKAPGDFMRMAAAVAKAHDAVQFLYVGGGPLRGEMENLIRELNLEGKVVLAGLRRDVPQLLKLMDIFVLTSLWEGLPRVFPQAMAAGLPVVATNVGGASEIVHDGVSGFLVAPGDYNAAAEKVLCLLRDPECRGAMAEKGRAAVYPDFDVNHMARQIEQLYEELLKTR